VFLKIRDKIINKFVLDNEINTFVVFNSNLKNHFLYKKFLKHIGVKRRKWLLEELESGEESINVICFDLKTKKIIATRCFYQALHEDTYNITHEHIKSIKNEYKYFIGHKLVVSKQYRNKGYATKLVKELNNILFENEIDFILGDSISKKAWKIYQKNGAICVKENGKRKDYFYKNNLSI